MKTDAPWFRLDGVGVKPECGRGEKLVGNIKARIGNIIMYTAVGEITTHTWFSRTALQKRKRRQKTAK